MTAFVEAIVQKFTEAAPIETTMSNIVAGVLESTAAKLARFERDDEPRQEPGEEAA
jgi:hypothetical protein